MEVYEQGTCHKGLQDNPNALNRPPPTGVHETTEKITNRLISKENLRLELARHAYKSDR